MFDVIDAIYIEGYRIHLYFENGVEGILDFEEYLDKSGLFTNFKDINYFKNFHINKDIGTICWANELDIAPETLYDKITKETITQLSEIHE